MADLIFLMAGVASVVLMLRLAEFIERRRLQAIRQDARRVVR